MIPKTDARSAPSRTWTQRSIAVNALADQYSADMLHTRALTGLVEVDRLRYEWAVQREPQWCTVDGWRGMVVSVCQLGQQRQALLEFPMPESGNGSQYRRRPPVNDTIAANGIRAALAAGWDPTSRGKPDTYMVDANGN